MRRVKIDNKKPLVKLMLDSGVFSAWNRREPFDLDGYIKYVQDHKQYVDTYVNADKIPGEFGKPRTDAEVRESAEVSWANLNKMWEAGLKPIPVFHQGEEWKWLLKMIDAGEEYIGIATIKDLPINDQRAWLDEVFTILCDSKGLPYVRTHGFGITRPSLLLRYPWYTCDSTTWSLSPGYGHIHVPKLKNGEPDYDDVPTQVIFSDRFRESASATRRFEGHGPLEQAAILDFIKRVGVTLEELIYVPDTRRRAMLMYYEWFSERHTIKPFIHKVGSFDDDLPLINIKKRYGKMWKSARIIQASNLNKAWAKIMNDVGAHHRLLSWWELKDQPTEVLVEYVENGIAGEHKKLKPKQDWRGHYDSFRRMSLLRKIEEYRNEAD